MRLLALLRGGASALALLAALGCSTVGGETRSLAISAPGYLVQGRPLVLGVEQTGALAGKEVSLAVVVDGILIDRVPGAGGSRDIRIAAEHLGVGWHDIEVKTGTEHVSVRVRVLSPILPIGLVALLGVMLGALYLGRRRPTPEG